MSTSLGEIYFWSFGLAGLLFAGLALYLAVGWRGGQVGARLIAAIVCSLLWALFAAVSVTSTAAPQAALASHFFDMTRAGAWTWFLLGLLAVPAQTSASQARLRSMRRSGVVLVLGLGGGALLAPALGVPLRWAILGLLALSIWLLALVEQVYRNFPANSRWGIKPLCVGLAATGLFDLYLYAEGFLFGRVDAEVAAVRGIVHALAVPLIAMSAVRSRAWRFRITVSRDLVFHTTAIASSGTYLVLVALAGYYLRWFGGEWGRALQAVSLFAGGLGLALLVFSGSLRARVRVWLNKHLFAYRYDYRSAWLAFTKALSRPNEQGLSRSVIAALGDLVESPAGVLFMREAEGDFSVKAVLNRAELDVCVAHDSDLVRFMETRGWIVAINEWRNLPARYDNIPEPEWLATQHDAWLIVPLLNADKLIGFVLLDNARAPVDIDWEVLDLLKTAGVQAASYLAQSQATSALLEAQKFDSFNRMSAFVVHDLKNLVAQMSLMLRNADRHKDNPEFQADMLMTVEHVVERMRGLMLQLQHKSPIEPPVEISLASICEAIAARWRSASTDVRCTLAADIAVLAHGERLERVIGHVVQNAIEAAGQHGKVCIELSRAAEEAVLVVSDNGCGMSAEFVRERLFRPFQTTKASGTGIGAYEVQQYVRELGGRVAVHSVPDEGTRFSIFIPVAMRKPRIAA